MKVSVIGLSGLSLFFKLDHLPNVGETILTDKLHKEYGGKGFNQAIVLANMGVNVSFLTKVGTDDSADACEEVLRKHNVHKYGTRKEGSTAIGVIYTSIDGNNEVIVYEGVSKDLDELDVIEFENEIKESEFLLIQMETSLDVLKKSLELAKKYNTKVVLNAAPAIYKLSKEELDSIDIVVVNENEAKTLFAIPDEIKISEYGNFVYSKYKCTIVITLGEDGSTIVNNNGVHQIPAFNVQAVDTTGAGDTFIGLLTYGLLNSLDIIKAANIASYGSSLAVSKHYVIGAIPDKKIIDNMINK